MFRPITLSSVLAASITSCMESGAQSRGVEAMSATSKANLWIHGIELSSNVLLSAVDTQLPSSLSAEAYDNSNFSLDL